MRDFAFSSVVLWCRYAQTSWRDQLRQAMCLGIWLIVLGCAGCRQPKNQKILVAYIEGDGFSRSASAKDWKYEQGVECVLASDSHQFPPDSRGDVLLCGEQTQHVWSMVSLRSDVKDQVYKAARMSDVTFRGAGRGSRTWGTSWSCKRLSQGIDCE